MSPAVEPHSPSRIHPLIAVALIVGALTPVVALPIAARFMGEQLNAVKIGCAFVAVGGEVQPAPAPRFARTPAPAPDPTPPTPPEPVYVTAAKQRKKIPIWAMATLSLMPIWAFMYVRAVTEPPATVEGPLGMGAEETARALREGRDGVTAVTGLAWPSRASTG